MGQRLRCCGLELGEQPGLSWWGGRMFVSLPPSIPWLLLSKDPLTDWLSHMEMEKREYTLSCYCMSVCVWEAVSWVPSLARPRRTACRTGCPSPSCLRAVKQSPAILALSLSNKVVYYKWISQLGLDPQSSGNLSTNLVWVSSCSEIRNEVGFMRFQVLLKTFQPTLVSSCCFFSFLPLVCLWYF